MKLKHFLLLPPLLVAPLAQADIYKCTDAAGHVTYANTGGRNCLRLNLDPVPSSPAGSASSPAAKPASRPPAAASSPNFPRVDDSTQRARDTDRRRILETELAAEQKLLEQAQKELGEQEAVRNGDERNYQKVLDRLQPYKDRVALHERNLQALRKEIANLR